MPPFQCSYLKKIFSHQFVVRDPISIHGDFFINEPDHLIEDDDFFLDDQETDPDWTTLLIF